MSDEPIDLLQIKIEKAKRELPLETVNAINSVDWKTAILGLRQKRGYTFEQLGDLELETEVLLAGLVSVEDYPKELSRRMNISKSAADDLVNEMNNLVFKKIREELIKNTERKKIFAKGSHSPLEEYPKGEVDKVPPPRLSATPQEGNKSDTAILNKAGIEIIPIEPVKQPEANLLLPELMPPSSPSPILGEGRGEALPLKPSTTTVVGNQSILAQKLSTPMKIPTVKTEHTINNLTKTSVPISPNMKTKIPNADPYREVPE